MNNYGFTNARPGIDMSEVASVKEMIFNKSREKAAAMAAEREENVTQSVQNDVMQDARASISNGRMKPFGVLTKNTQSFEQEIKPQENTQKEIPQLKHTIESVDNSVYTASMRDEAMNEARRQYSRKPTLMETLNFLNTQAAIRMVNKTHSKIV